MKHLISLPSVPLRLALALLGAASGGQSTHAQFVDGQIAASVLGQPGFATTFPSVPPTASSLSGPRGLAVDPKTGTVYVADTNNSRVLRYDSLDALRSGEAAAGVLGQPDMTSLTTNTTQSGMRHPQGLHLDGSGRLWVADTDNHRILWFNKAAQKANGAPADGVLGQSNFTNMGSSSSNNRMNGPQDVTSDASGSLYVADTGNHRVLRFLGAANLSSGAAADRVIGQADFTAGSDSYGAGNNRMRSPGAVIAQSDTVLWVADTSNHRVLGFILPVPTNGANAQFLLGQSSFSDTSAGTSASRLSFPRGLAMDAAYRLYIADSVNHRVLVHHQPNHPEPGGPANRVLGASDFTDSFGGSTGAQFNHPTALAVHPDGHLFVADRLNHRVLRFAPTSVPTVRAGTRSVKLAPGRRKSVAFTLSNENHPGAYRISYPRSNRYFTAASSVGSGSVTPTLAPGSQHRIAIRFKARRSTKRPVPFHLSAQGVDESSRRAVAATRVAVR